MGWATLFAGTDVVGFILLFTRLGALLAAMPLFSHTSIPPSLKAVTALFMTFIFFPLMPAVAFEVTAASLGLAVLGELLFGLAVGLVLQLAFHAVTFAAGQISYMMGFSFASAVDPESGISMPVISQFLTLSALVTLFGMDLHHGILLYAQDALSAVPPGGFMLSQTLVAYLLRATGQMFIAGFIIAFPVMALSLLADLLFGMLMRTMPQFNLLVIGFPIRIALALLVLIATFGAMMLAVENGMNGALGALRLLY